MTITFEIGTNLFTLGTRLMALYDELNEKLDELTATASEEHTQVMAAIQELQDQLTAALSASLTADQLVSFREKFDATKAAVSGVYNPPTQ